MQVFLTFLCGQRTRDLGLSDCHQVVNLQGKDAGNRVATGGNEPGAIRAEGYAIDRTGMAVEREWLWHLPASRRQLPDLDRAIHTGTGQRSAIRTKGDAKGGACVTRQLEYYLSRCGIPHLDGSIIPDGGDPFAIRTEGNPTCTWPSPWPLKLSSCLPVATSHT